MLCNQATRRSGCRNVSNLLLFLSIIYSLFVSFLNLIIATILRSVIPGLMVFLGKNDYVWERMVSLMESNYDFRAAQTAVFVVGLGWAALVIPVQFALTQRKLKEREEQYGNLLGFAKGSIMQTIEESLPVKGFRIKIRVFVPERRGRLPWGPYTSLKLVEVPGISDDFPVQDLTFDLVPAPEGLVGLAFAEKRVLIDPDVQGNEEYLIPQRNAGILRKVRFCGAIPLFNGDKVRAVIGLDSEESLAEMPIEERKRLIENLNMIVSLVDKYCIVKE